jgi:hypothetical protein
VVGGHIEGLESDPPVVNTTCHRGQKKPAIDLDLPAEQ